MRASGIWSQTGIVFERHWSQCCATTRWLYSSRYSLLYVSYELTEPAPNAPPEFLVAHCPSDSDELQLLLVDLVARHAGVGAMAEPYDAWDAVMCVHFAEAAQDNSPWIALSGEELEARYLTDEHLEQHLPAPSSDLSAQDLFDIIMVHISDY